MQRLQTTSTARSNGLEPGPTLEEVKALPKVELHAHLSGSITQEKLIDLLLRFGNGATFTPFDCRADLSNALTKCFDYFAKVATVVSNLSVLRESTLHVLETFAADNCIYLELRTSPKQFSTCSGELTTKLQYLETVRDAIREFQQTSNSRFGFVMEVKILLSVDRGKVSSKESALEQIDDILTMQKEHPDLVVGIDVCGNPSKASVTPHLMPALLERKDAFQKLPITFHTAEIEDDEESWLILNSMRELNIRRLGHVCFFPDECRQRVLKGIFDDGGVGIEICPTSNLVTRELKNGLADHHFLDWWKKSDKVLLSINTDDTGLFSCSLSSEVHDLASTFQLSRKDLLDVERQAIISSFHPEKDRLLSMFDSMASTSVPKGGSGLTSDSADGRAAKRPKL